MTALSFPLPMSLPLHWPTDLVDPSARVPHPPSEAERARRRPTPLWQAVLLAGLLHLWAALLLGSVPPGSALPGQGVWGAINLRLQAPGDALAEPALRQAEAKAPLPATGPVGDAAATRWGGAVRAERPAPAAAPGAARFGDWAPVPAVAATSSGLPATALAAAPAAALDSLPSLPPLTDRPDPPRLQAPPAISPVPQGALPSLPAAPAAHLPPLPALPSATALASPLAQLPAQPVPSLSAPSAALTPLTSTAAAAFAALPLALPELPAVQAPDTLLPTAPRLAAPVQSVAPLAQQTVHEAAAPLTAAELPSLPQLAGVATLPADAAAADADANANANANANVKAQLAPVAPGRPDAGTRTGADIATAPSAPASAPRLNLQLPRSRGGELSRLGSAGVLAVMPRPPELKSRLASEAEKSGQADCRTAHARMGLLAVVPLVADALKAEGGCRW